MFNRITTWARAHRNLFIWLGIGITIFICWSIWSSMISDPIPTTQTTSNQTQPAAPSGGWFFWKFLALLELLCALLTYKENSQSKRLPIVFFLASLGSCLVIYGEFKELFQWAVAGTPIAAYFFFLMSQRAKSERQSAFLMTVCGILSLTFVYLLFKKLGLIVSIEAALKDYTGLSINILLIFAGLFGGLTIYKKKISFCIIALLFLGFWSYDNPQFKSMVNVLNPTISDKTKNTWENAWDWLLNEINSTLKPAPVVVPPPPISSSGVTNTAPQSIAQPAITLWAYAPKDAHNVLQVPEGIWEVSSPPGALARRANGSVKEKIINQQIPGEVYVYPPPGISATITLTKK